MIQMTEYLSREDILDIASQYCTDDDGSCSKADVDLREMLDEIEALPAADVQPVNQWISCKDRMPEDNDRVLILAKNESVYIAKHRVFGHFVVSFEYWLDDTEVTHWMPLPEPPKDGEQDD